MTHPTRTQPRHFACIACGYHLDGLTSSDQCPECGLAVALSDGATSLPQPAIAAIRLAATGILVAIILGLALITVIVISSQTDTKGASLRPVAAGLLATIAGTLVCVSIGSFSLARSIPARRGPFDATKRRTALRSLSVALGVTSLVSAAVPLVQMQRSAPSDAIEGATFIAFCVLLAVLIAFHLCSLSYLAWLATCVPDTTLHRSVQHRLATAVALYVLLALLTAVLPIMPEGAIGLWSFASILYFVAPVAFLSSYCQTLRRLRTQVGRLRKGKPLLS